MSAAIVADAGGELQAGLDAALAGALDANLLRALDRLTPHVRRSFAQRLGRTPMPRGTQPSGIELETHLPYAPGDDLRHVDWNAYGRLDELLVRAFRAERELPWWIFVDASSSMCAPSADGKLAFAAGLTACLAYLATATSDPLHVVAVGGDLPAHHRAAARIRHRGRLAELRTFLRALRPSGATVLQEGIEAAVARASEPGVALVLSDFLTPPPQVEATLRHLLARRFTVAAIRVLGPTERDPSDVFRRGRIVDAESSESRAVRLDGASLAHYQAALAGHLAGLAGFCRREGIAFAIADPQLGLRDFLLRQLPLAGFLR